jgi:hypothetical protein
VCSVCKELKTHDKHKRSCKDCHAKTALKKKANKEARIAAKATKLAAKTAAKTATKTAAKTTAKRKNVAKPGKKGATPKAHAVALTEVPAKGARQEEPTTQPLLPARTRPRGRKRRPGPHNVMIRPRVLTRPTQAAPRPPPTQPKLDSEIFSAGSESAYSDDTEPVESDSVVEAPLSKRRSTRAAATAVQTYSEVPEYETGPSSSDEADDSSMGE